MSYALDAATVVTVSLDAVAVLVGGDGSDVVVAVVATIRR